MEIQSAFNVGVQGFDNATQRANEAAVNIVEATTIDEAGVINNEASAEVNTASVPDLNQEIVNLKVAEHQAKASSEVIQTADEILGTLLDVTA